MSSHFATGGARTATAPATPSALSTGQGTASGKVILLGEHAVVYGVPALAVGIDRGARAKASFLDGPDSILKVAGWDAIVVSDRAPTTDLGRGFAAIVSAARKLEGSLASRGAVNVVAHADVPPGGGLGCSAALGVAIARSLVPTTDAAVILDLAGAWERVFHGNPSGIDATVAAHGGCILFEKGAPIVPVKLPAPLSVAIGSTGVASSTKTMVEGVARLKEKKPEIVEKAFSGIAALVANGRLALEAGDVTGLGKLMDLNQMILSGLLVSTEEIERLVGAAREAGALGAKLTGAGGGGCVVALASDGAVTERIVSAWSALGFTGFAAVVAA